MKIFSNKKILFITVASGVFMSTLDSSMINVALPTIMQSFNSPLPVTQWVVQIYLLTVTVLLIFWGKVGDHWGRGKVYAGGMLVFSVGSLLCALSQNIQFLVFFRFCQAIGASMMMATGPALMTSVFPPKHLGRGMGMIGIAVSLGLMSGPVLSGLLIKWYHWRALFYITIPVGLVFYFLSRNALRDVDRDQSGQDVSQTTQSKRFSFDWLGGLLYVSGISMTLIVLTRISSLSSSTAAGSQSMIWAGFILAAVIMFLFFKREYHTETPLLPFHLFKRRDFRMGILSAVLSFSVLFVVLLLTPFFLAQVLALPADRIGIVMMSLPCSVFIVSPFAGWLHDRIGVRLVATGGLGISLMGLVSLVIVIPLATPVTIAAGLALLGCGQAAFLSPNSAGVLLSVDKKDTGITASLLATARNMGMLVGVAFGSLIFAWHFAKYTGGLDVKDFTSDMTLDFIRAMCRTFEYAIGLAVCGIVASWMRGPVRG